MKLLNLSDLTNFSYENHYQQQNICSIKNLKNGACRKFDFFSFNYEIFKSNINFT